ncbi:hypothetical protein EV356DRAFT_456550 [Viridothelium virens]|uniref:DUF6594 domain-containing protein n=1 Tax=Viridothelium virens TaxID=1048519 RepID=A0A6A6GTF9_VIRVR|nr:hypothetical protein EV356DRAFT_456550 [Viridothelium virens]
MSSAQGPSASAVDAIGNEKLAPVGYPKLARMMSFSSETTIFRRFRELHMLNLLRLQAELHDMEHELQEIRREDAESNDPVRMDYAQDFHLMRDSADTNDSLQYDLLNRIGQKLKDYARQIGAANSPHQRDVKFLQNWLVRPKMGSNFLVGHERTIWDDSNISDFVTIQPQQSDRDAFTFLLNGALLTFYDRIYGHRKTRPDSRYGAEDIREYDDAKILRLSKVLSGTLSSLLPTLAILILYFVRRMIIRIALVIIFTGLFSMTLSLLTEAKRVEVFSATAAFAAVEVVFIGSSATNGTA